MTDTVEKHAFLPVNAFAEFPMFRITVHLAGEDVAVKNKHAVAVSNAIAAKDVTVSVVGDNPYLHVYCEAEDVDTVNDAIAECGFVDKTARA